MAVFCWQYRVAQAWDRLLDKPLSRMWGKKYYSAFHLLMFDILLRYKFVTQLKQAAGHTIEFECGVSTDPRKAILLATATQLSKQPPRFAYVCKDVSDRVRLQKELVRYTSTHARTHAHTHALARMRTNHLSLHTRAKMWLCLFAKGARSFTFLLNANANPCFILY